MNRFPPNRMVLVVLVPLALFVCAERAHATDISGTGSNGAACGGICLVNSNNNRMHKSTFYGNGSVDYANGNVDFGTGFEGSSSQNLVEGNDIGGNTNGLVL